MLASWSWFREKRILYFAGILWECDSFDGEKGQIIVIFCIFNFIKMRYPQGWRRVVFIIFWISGILCYVRAQVVKPFVKWESVRPLAGSAMWQNLSLAQGVSISVTVQWLCTPGGQRRAESAGARARGSSWQSCHTRDCPLFKENECKGLISLRAVQILTAHGRVNFVSVWGCTC